MNSTAHSARHDTDDPPAFDGAKGAGEHQQVGAAEQAQYCGGGVHIQARSKANRHEERDYLGFRQRINPELSL